MRASLRFCCVLFRGFARSSRMGPSAALSQINNAASTTRRGVSVSLAPASADVEVCRFRGPVRLIEVAECAMSYLVERTIGNAPFDQYHVGAINYMGVNQLFRYCIAKIISTSKPRSWVQHLTPPNGLHSEAILDMF